MLTDKVVQELRAIARSHLAALRPGHTLQPTALVNEAWIKLRHHFEGREGTPAFYKTAADAMRQILIDHARARQSRKRGGDAQRVGISDIAHVAAFSEEIDPSEIMALDEAVSRLEQEHAATAQVVKLRFFAGLSVEETAAALGISDRTVKREWRFARAWLFERLRGGESAGQ